MSILTFNVWALLVCIVLSMVSGTLWYNPKTFFPIWWKGLGKPEMVQPGSSNMAVVWILTVLSSAMQVVGLAILVNLVGAAFGTVTLVSGLLAGALLWLFIVAPTNLTNKLFAGFGFKVWAIEAGNHLLNFLIFGMILGLWR